MHLHALGALTYSTPQERGRQITMIHKLIIFSSNITKLTTPSELTLYLQIIIIANEPLTHSNNPLIFANTRRRHTYNP